MCQEYFLLFVWLCKLNAWYNFNLLVCNVFIKMFWFQVKQTINAILADSSIPEDKKKTLEDKLKTLPNSAEPENGEHEIQKNKSDNEERIFFSPNTAYPSLSSSITINYEKDRGRYATAAKNIKVGEMLVCESPIGAKLRKELTKDHCENCLRYLHNLLIPGQGKQR